MADATTADTAAITAKATTPTKRKMLKNIFVILYTFGVITQRAAATVASNSKTKQNVGNTLISTQQKTAQYSIAANMSQTRIADLDCPSLADADYLTQTQLISRLTNSCRYDRLEPPFPMDNGALSNSPVKVYVRVFIYILQNLDSSDLQFKIQGLLQMRYEDKRLAFAHVAPSRTQPIMGESQLRDQIWVPHIIIANEESSSVLGTSKKDIVVSISPEGTIITSTRIEATLYCWMNFKKFPFDQQKCSVIFESWMYNTSWLMMHWESTNPVSFAEQLQITEYDLESFSYNESIIASNSLNMRHGALTGNYSTLSFSVVLTREVGYYIMDYFLPSIMIVAISWVSFWLQADQTPARTTLGTTTMLSFITLSLSQENNLSKVSYITLSEVWFLVCTFFIFGSLVEFAFVNTVWRRNNDVVLKKRTFKYIIKSTFVPNSKRSDCCQNANGGNTIITIEAPIVIDDVDAAINDLNRDTPSTSSTLSIEDNTAQDSIVSADAKESKESKELEAAQVPSTWSTMTPREVSLWIDRKMRFIFPLAFIIFNALFWTLVYCLD